MILRALFVICLCLPHVARAEITTSDLIVSVDAGLICPPPDMATAPAPDTLAGTTNIITKEPPFAMHGQQVPAVMGLGFGIKSQSQAVEGISDVTMVVTHPPMGPTGATQQQFQTSISGLDPSLTFYSFDHKYELVRGTWTMTAFAGDKQLFTVSFEVIDPRLMPDVARICNYEDLLS